MQNKYFISLILITLVGCSKEPKSMKASRKVDFSLVLASYISSEPSEIQSCGDTNYDITSKFTLVSLLKGSLNSEGFVVSSCEHWEEKPFEGKQIDGLEENYNFKWLLLIEKKEGKNHLIERKPVFKLSNNSLAFCDTSKYIGKLLDKENKDLGEFIGSPVKIQNQYSEDFYKKSPCFNIRDGHAFLEKGITLGHPRLDE